MASLFNTKISNTYVGLLKLSDNLVLSSTLREISDGSGNGAGVFLNTSGDLKASGILEFGSLRDTGTSITISKFVNEADGIANNDNDTTIPTSAAIVDYVAARITLEDLDFSGDSGTGSVDLDSQVFAIVGTANEIETSAGSQQLQIGLPSNVTISSNLQVNGLLKGNNNIVIKDTSDRTMAAFYGGDKSEIYFNDSKKFETTSSGVIISGSITATASSTFTSASFSGTITGNITGVGTLSDGSTAVTQSINDNSTKIATTAYVDASVDTVDTLSEILAVGNTTGGTNIAVSANDDITFTDTSKAIFGDGNDLQIFHTANSFIYNTTGDLILEQTVDNQDIVFKSDDGAGGTTEYFKLDGTQIKTIFSKTTRFNDSVRAEFGSSGDLDIYHDGTDSYIDNNGGDLYIMQQANNKDISFQNDDGAGGTTEYVKIDGSADRTIFSRSSRHNDNVVSAFGTSEDLQIYHDGSDSYIDEGGTGGLKIESNSFIDLQTSNGGAFTGRFINGGAVELYHSGSKKFETTSTGVTVTGSVSANSGSGTAILGSHLDLGDNQKARFGASQDLQIYHDASNSIIADTGTGLLKLLSNGVEIKNASDSGYMAFFGSTGASELYHNGSKKFETTSSGVTLTGDLTTSGDAIINGSDIILNSTGDSATSTITMGGNDTGNKVNSILFAENRSSGAMTFGFTLTNEGASSNNFIIKNHNNSSTGSSALTIARDNGAITTGGNMTVSGDLTVNGTTTTVNTQTLAVEDPLISLAKDNSANSVDIGFYGRYNDGSDKYLGLFADASDSSTFKLFKGTGTEPTTTVDTTASGFAYADLDIGTTLGLTTHGGGWFMEDTTFMKTVNNKSLYGTGNVHMTSFVSVADSAYYLTPAESTTSLKLAGDIILVDGKKLKGTTFADSFIQFNSNGNTRIKANDNVILGYGTTLTINNSGVSTFAGNLNVDADLKIRGASGEDHFVIAPQAAGSGTILISYNGAETGYEPLVIDAENFTFRHSGTPIISTSGTTTTFAGNVTTSGTIKSTLAIDNSTLPDVPSEHVIQLNPPTTTNYYGGGIGWSESSNTAASLGVYDNGTGGALGMYFATGDNSSVLERMRITKTGEITLQNSDGIRLSAQNSSLYSADGALSYYGTDNAVYLNGAGTNGWLRLQASGAENNRNAINIYGGGSVTPNDTIDFRTGDIERARINSSGDVLLGNTVVNPASGFANQRGFGFDTSTGAVEIAATSGRAFTVGRNENSDGDIIDIRKESTIIGSFGSNTTGGQPLLDISGNTSNGNIRFKTSNTEAVRIDSSQRVGIGTGSPSEILHTNKNDNGNVVGGYFTNSNANTGAESVSLAFGLNRSGGDFVRQVKAITFAAEQQWTGTPSTVDGYLSFSTIADETVGERLRIDGDGQVRINPSSIDCVDSSATAFDLQMPNGIAFGGNTFTYCNIFGSGGNMTIAANAYPANTGSTSTITFKTSTSSGGTHTPLVIDGNNATFAGNVNTSNLLAFNETVFGYSSTYKVLQLGESAATKAISIGYNPSGNSNGGFSGNEILLPNNRRIMAANAADDQFYGLMMFDSNDKLLIGSSNYLIDSNFIMCLTPANKRVGFGTNDPQGKVHISDTDTQLVLETPNNANDIDLRFREDGDNKWNLSYQNSSSNLIFYNQTGTSFSQLELQANGNTNTSGGLLTVRSDTDTNQATYEQTLTIAMTLGNNGVAIPIAFVDHTHALDVTVIVKQDTSNVATGVGRSVAAYGAASTGLDVVSHSSGNISNIALAYLNTNPSGQDYVLTLTPTFSAGVPPTAYVTIRGNSTGSIAKYS